MGWKVYEDEIDNIEKIVARGSITQQQADKKISLLDGSYYFDMLKWGDFQNSPAVAAFQNACFNIYRCRHSESTIY